MFFLLTPLTFTVSEGAAKSVDHDDVFGFNEAIPETERLDSKVLKTRAHLIVKSKRHKPSRVRLGDSISSTDGEDSIERKNVTVSDDFSPSSTSSADLSGLVVEPKFAERSHSLALSSDESLDMIDDEIMKEKSDKPRSYTEIAARYTGGVRRMVGDKQEFRAYRERGNQNVRRKTKSGYKPEILDESQSPKHSQWQSRTPLEWSSQQVTNWLMTLNLNHCVSEFAAQNVNGEQLLQLDSARLKALGLNAQDRTIIKKKIKDMKVTIEKVRKANEKMEKQKERLRKKEQDQQLPRVRHENTSEDPAQSPQEP
ncbi:unnamed protein product [Ranitomeya imitator]|uniref:SAM domain-containing protein n=1 Tax=Ranitomeya imitator TaxID=111125 RepID=A0ABN9LPV7_9NEOB|nr:unnamed protein product [Ranitomeya imitator]